MAVSYLLIIFIFLYGLAWISLAAGQIFIRTGNELAISIKKFAWNARIEQFKYPPFSLLVKLWTRKRYIPTSVLFFAIMFTADLLFFFVGVFLLVPVLTIVQGGIKGILWGEANRKNTTWLLAVCAFEFGHFAFAGSLGLLISYTALLTDVSLTQSILIGYKTLAAGYWLPIVLCIIGNSILDVAGPIYWGMKGAMGLDVLSNQSHL